WTAIHHRVALPSKDRARVLAELDPTHTAAIRTAHAARLSHRHRPAADPCSCGHRRRATQWPNLLRLNSPMAQARCDRPTLSATGHLAAQLTSPLPRGPVARGLLTDLFGKITN